MWDKNKNLYEKKEKTKMNKTELIKAVAEKAGYTQKDVKTVMETLQEVVFDAIKTEEVKLMDGVTLSAVFKEATTARNPLTGATVDVPAKYAPKCKFGKAIKNAINA